MVAMAAIVVAAGVLVLPTPASAATRDLSDLAVTRHGGADRYSTSLLVAQAVAEHAGGSVEAVVLVSGLSWPDAVVAAPLAGTLGAPLLMTPPDQLRADAAAFLDTARTDAAAASTASVELRVFGGDAAVSQAALDTYLDPTSAAAEDSEAEDPEITTTLPPGTCGGSIDDKPYQLTDVNTSQDAAWSPDCSKIVYSRGGSLWTMNNDGSGQRRWGWCVNR